MQKIDFDDLAASLLRSAPELVRQWLPSGKLEGSEWCCGSIKGDKGRSLKVNIKTGAWADFAGNEKGGDLISLYKEIHNLPTMIEAARILSGQPEPKAKAQSYEPKEARNNDTIEPIPEDLQPPKLKIEGFEYNKSWVYRNAQGQKIYIVQRYDGPDGKKEIRPWRMVGGKLSSKQLPKPRPLYNLDKIAAHPDKPIMIVEGEKVASAASIFESYIATTWPMGSQNAQYVDWSPLKGRQSVIIIPDADDAGYAAARWIGNHLQNELKIPRVTIVDTSSKPKGWDLADDQDSMVPVRDTSAFIKANMLTYEQYIEKIYSEESKPFTGASLRAPSYDDLDPIGVGSGPAPGIVEDINYHNELLINPYFRFLGFKNESFFFYIYKTGQIVHLNSKQCGEEGHLVILAPPDFWKESFEGNLKSARVALVSLSQDIRFNPRKVRKLGIWMDEKGPVAHLGEYIMTSKEVMPLRHYKSKYVYEYSEHRVEFDELPAPATTQQAKILIDICMNSNWVEPTHGKVLAGWMFMSLICASLRWRSHIYIIGPAGSGKTWLLDNVVDKFFCEFKMKAAGSSTEASIRQGLDNNMIPVIFDEAEAEDVNANVRRKAIFELARFASAATPDTPIVKGTISSTGAREFFVRSPFLFASINTSMDHADESRTTFLKLAPFDRDNQTRAKFKSNELMTRRIMNRNYTCSMMRRAINLLPSMIDGYELFVDALLSTVAQDARQAEQMSYFVTGLWFLQNDSMPNPEEAEEFVKEFYDVSKQRTSMLSSEEKLITLISQIKIDCEINGRPMKRTVGELATLAQKYGRAEDLDKTYENAAMALKRAGMMVAEHENRLRFYVMNESVVVRAGLYGTSFYPSWDKVLARVKGALEHQDIRYLGSQGPSVSFPLKAFIGDISEFKKTVDNPF